MLLLSEWILPPVSSNLFFGFYLAETLMSPICTRPSMFCCQEFSLFLCHPRTHSLHQVCQAIWCVTLTFEMTSYAQNTHPHIVQMSTEDTPGSLKLFKWSVHKYHHHDIIRFPHRSWRYFRSDITPGRLSIEENKNLLPSVKHEVTLISEQCCICICQHLSLNWISRESGSSSKTVTHMSTLPKTRTNQIT